MKTCHRLLAVALLAALPSIAHSYTTTPETFGAVGDGVANDCQAFKNALVQIAAMGGGTLNLTAGKNYRIRFTIPTDALNVPASTTIQGNGNTIYFDASDSGYHGLFNVFADNVTLRDFKAVRASNFAGVFIPFRASNFTLRNVEIDGQRNVFSNYIHALRAENTGPGSGIVIQNTVLDNVHIHHVEYGLFMSNDSATQLQHTQVTNSYFHHNYSDDLQFNAPNGSWTDILVDNCTFADNQSPAPDFGAGFAVGFAKCVGASNTNRNNIVQRCRFVNYNTEAVHIEDGSLYFQIKNNVFMNCSRQGYGVIEIITGSGYGTIADNFFDMRAVGQRFPCVSILPSGDNTRTPQNITIQGNTFLLGWDMLGVTARQTIDTVVSNNLFEGDGIITSGTFTGGFNYGVFVSASSGGTITNNGFKGLGSGIEHARTPDPATSPAVNSTITYNSADQCQWNLQYHSNLAPGVTFGWNTQTPAPPPTAFPENARTTWGVDDAPYPGVANGSEPWIWEDSPVLSGTQSHVSSSSTATMHHHTFDSATPLAVGASDTLYAYIYIDGANPPTEVMLQYRVNPWWEHRAYWGANNIPLNGVLTRVGDLPPRGRWFKLAVPASQVDVVGSSIDGIGFVLYGGKVWWDRAGLQPPPPTVAPLFASGFETGDTALSWANSFNPISNVGGQSYTVATGAAHLGSRSLLLSGSDNATSNSYAYARCFSVSIPVTSQTKLSYWIRPVNANGRFVAVDFQCTDGTVLRGSGAVDYNSFTAHPNGGHGGALPLNYWSKIQCDIGKAPGLAGKTINMIWVAYDQPGQTGAFSAYVDDITITNGRP